MIQSDDYTKRFMELKAEYPDLSDTELLNKMSEEINVLPEDDTPVTPVPRVKREPLPPRESVPDTPNQILYKWSTKISAEQNSTETRYLPPSIYEDLLYRLKNSEGQIISVTGMQGVGKTEMRNQLHWELVGDNSENPRAIRARWRGQDALLDSIVKTLSEFSSANRFYRDSVLSAIRVKIGGDGVADPGRMTKLVEKNIPKFKRDNDAEIIANVLINPRVYDDDPQGFFRSDRVRELFPVLRDYLNKSDLKEMRKRIFAELMSENYTFLLDFQDYSKRNHSVRDKDWADFQEFWVESIERQALEDPQVANIVMFYQKELWSDHFLPGKVDEMQILPHKAQTMVDFIHTQVLPDGGCPFTDDGILMVAQLALGNFRKFKRYITVCLDHNRKRSSGTETISAADVTDWITTDVLKKDWERELGDVFPIGKIRRGKAIEVMKILFNNGGVGQSDLVKSVFDNRMDGSRVLQKMEEHGFIIRTRVGRENIVKLGGE